MSWLDRFEGISPTRRIVLATGPITRFVNMRSRQSMEFKPKGLWYACGDAWLDWLDSGMPEWKENTTHIYELKLGVGVLYLKSAAEVEEFAARYAKGRFPGDRSAYIDWPTVARRYTGIEICPYQWELRMKAGFMWYYGWDVASGCIWAQPGVSQIMLLATKPGVG